MEPKSSRCIGRGGESSTEGWKPLFLAIFLAIVRLGRESQVHYDRECPPGLSDGMVVRAGSLLCRRQYKRGDRWFVFIMKDEIVNRLIDRRGHKRFLLGSPFRLPVGRDELGCLNILAAAPAVVDVGTHHWIHCTYSRSFRTAYSPLLIRFLHFFLFSRPVWRVPFIGSSRLYCSATPRRRPIYSNRKGSTLPSITI